MKERDIQLQSAALTDQLRALGRQYAEHKEATTVRWLGTEVGFTIGEHHYVVKVERDTKFEKATGLNKERDNG
jgi:hypothetical protein